MPMTGKEVIKLLEQNGWKLDRIASSHFIMKKGGQSVSVPVHSGQDLGPGLLNSILKQAGLK